MEYCVWSFEHRGWWVQSRCGYTKNKEEAGRFSEEVAFFIVADANVCGDINECLVPTVLMDRPDIERLFGEKL